MIRFGRGTERQMWRVKNAPEVEWAKRWKHRYESTWITYRVTEIYFIGLIYLTHDHCFPFNDCFQNFPELWQNTNFSILCRSSLFIFLFLHISVLYPFFYFMPHKNQHVPLKCCEVISLQLIKKKKKPART